MNPTTRWRGIALAAAAFGGTLAAHWTAYRLGVPGPVRRAQLLAATGHAYWLTAVKLAVGLGLVGAGAAFLSGFRETAADAHVALRYSGLLARLAALQIVAFLAMEAIERLAVGAPVAAMLTHGLLVLGLSAQFLVAAVGASLLSWLWRAGRTTARALRAEALAGHPPAVRPVPASRLRFSLAAGVLIGAAGVRGPPRP